MFVNFGMPIDTFFTQRLDWFIAAQDAEEKENDKIYYIDELE